MDVIVALLQQILSTVLTILGVDQQTQATILGLDLDTKINIIQQELITMDAQITALQVVCANIQSIVEGLATDIPADISALSTQVGTPTQTGLPVDIDAAQVWLYNIGSRGFVAEDFLGAAGQVAMNDGRGGALRAAYAGPFTLEDGFDNPNSRLAERGPPRISPLSILPDDTLYSWLQREWPVTELWSFNTDSQTFFYLDDFPEGDVKWRCTLSEAEFQALKSGGVVPAVLANVPPVWPGLDLVTLGSTTPLAPQMTITEVCDGVIVELHAVSANKTFFPYGGVNGYRGIGALSFFDDNGEQETYQPLMFTDQVYCCLAMSHAAGVRLRVDPSVSGTIQLWSITPT